MGEEGHLPAAKRRKEGSSDIKGGSGPCEEKEEESQGPKKTTGSKGDQTDSPLPSGQRISSDEAAAWVEADNSAKSSPENLPQSTKNGTAVPLVRPSSGFQEIKGAMQGTQRMHAHNHSPKHGLVKHNCPGVGSRARSGLHSMAHLPGMPCSQPQPWKLGLMQGTQGMQGVQLVQNMASMHSMQTVGQCHPQVNALQQQVNRGGVGPLAAATLEHRNQMKALKQRVKELANRQKQVREKRKRQERAKALALQYPKEERKRDKSTLTSFLQKAGGAR